jgi:hypothetical protein
LLEGCHSVKSRWEGISGRPIQETGCLEAAHGALDGSELPSGRTASAVIGLPAVVVARALAVEPPWLARPAPTTAVRGFVATIVGAKIGARNGARVGTRVGAITVAAHTAVVSPIVAGAIALPLVPSAAGGASAGGASICRVATANAKKSAGIARGDRAPEGGQGQNRNPDGFEQKWQP